jgi:hypothetical protein
VIDGHRDHIGRRRDAEPGEIGLQVGRPVAAAQLDDAHAFAGAVSGREIIERRELNRRERD